MLYNSSRPHLFNQGFTLVEILVAMLVGLFLLDGIVQVYYSNHTANRMINGLSAQQENTRSVLTQLSRSLRLSGHYGGLHGDEVNTIGTVSFTGVGSCNTAWITDVETPLRGYEGAANISSVAGFPSGCISDAHYLAQSDIFVVRYGSPSTMTPYASMDDSTVYLRSSLIKGVTGAELLLGSNKASSLVGSNADGVGTYNYEYKTELYYVRPCSSIAGGVCDDGIPTLVRLGIDGTELKVETIAEGVEQLQIEYGVDDDSDYVVDSYQAASAVTDWNRVVSVRFSFVIRSLQLDVSYTDSGSYTLVGGFSYTPDSSVQNHHRKEVTRLVQLRNMSRG